MRASGPSPTTSLRLCEEVRRDGGFALLPEVISHYKEQAQSPLSEADFCAPALFCRRSGIRAFSALLLDRAIKSGQRDKLGFMPRIQKHLIHILKETYLVPVKEWMNVFEGSTS